jgi:hypothetical protein
MAALPGAAQTQKDFGQWRKAMNNTELDKVLKKAQVPEPRPGFWDEMPTNVLRAITQSETIVGPREFVQGNGFLPFLFRKASLPLAFAAVCVLLGFFGGAHSRHTTEFSPAELAEARACWREVATLFPNQLQAIVFDQQGSRLVLSEQTNPQGSAPIFVKVCDGTNCERFITFSGQQIKMNGESFEVLIDRRGEVLLVGESNVWTSAKSAPAFGSYKVFARALANS